jgi:transposase-like protein
MDYTGIDPFTKKPVTIARGLNDRKMQRALMQFLKPQNWFEVWTSPRFTGARLRVYTLFRGETMPPARRSFAREFKVRAVKLVTEQGYSFAEAARRLGVRDHQIRTRKKQRDAEVGGAASGAGTPAAFDAELRQPDDRPSIGLFPCPVKNTVLVGYALRDTSEPIGVAG